VLQFILRRVLLMIPVLLGVSLVTFIIIRSIPGDPVQVLLGADRRTTPEQIEAIRAAYGLDQSLPLQYLKWLGHVLTGDLGDSLRTRRPLTTELQLRLPVTIQLTLMAGIIAARLGITGALGTQADVADGVYTGRLEGGLLHGPAKATAVRDLADRHGFDLARCFAYSDSHNDLPLLSLVGHPCAVNPDAKLLAHAEEQDWQVRDYRTGRRAVKVGALGAGTVGATAGAVLAGLAIRRHLRG
jgi:hypothetical protein